MSSPPVAVAPEPEPNQPIAASGTPLAETPDTPVAPDIDAIIAAKDASERRIAELEAAEQARLQEAQRKEQEDKAHTRSLMRQQEAQNAQQFASKLNDEDPALAQRFVQHRSFIEQERDEAFGERDVAFKSLDAAFLVLEQRDPNLLREIVATAQTLMPYGTHEEMSNVLTQQATYTSAKDAEIARLNQELAQLQDRYGVATRDPNADRVETGGTGIPVATQNLDPRQAQSWEEWAAIRAQRR